MLKTKSVKKIISLALSLLLAISLATPAFAAQKITNPDTRGGVDGIDSDPAIGVHNSYAWCSEVFTQADSDYIWVGMNRDLGAVLLGATESDLSMELFGIPDKNSDAAGRIYRQRVSDSETEWELIYQNNAISGYRKMIIFNDDLYVLAGLSNRASATDDYSIVLRFSKNYASGDSPEIVFWENVTGTTTEYFRSAAILDGKLYIGTFDSKIYVTDGEGLADLTPNNGPKDTGWSLLLDLPIKYFNVSVEGLPPVVPVGGAIWDLLAFNGAVYAFVSYTLGYIGVSAFGVFKITPNAGGYTMEQIVGDGNAPYPYGLGIGKNMTASGFLSTSFGEDYVYVSTFANGPAFLAQMATGNFDIAFNMLFCPAQMYRFDTNDNWEVVVGDTEGPNVAVDSSGVPVAFIGNQRAGFFLQDYDYQNVSFNQYIWWMIEHEGRLYATTWDMSVFKQYYGLMALYVLNGLSDNAVLMLMGYILAMQGQFQAIISAYAGVDVQALATELGAYLQALRDGLGQGSGATVDDIVDGFMEILGKYFPLEEQRALRDAIFAMVGELRTLELDYRKIITELLAFISATSLYFLDDTNPAGFDLFVSDDGVNFEPVTVDGFGDPCNYGGRVLVSSDHGLYVTTANPFNGGQVWRLSPMESGVYANGPEAVSLGVAEKDAMTVLVTDADAGNELFMSYSDSEIVEAKLVKRDTSKSVTDITWETKVVTDPGTGLKSYSVVETETVFITQMYDVVLEPVKAGQEDITFEFVNGGKTSVRSISVTVDIDAESFTITAQAGANGSVTGSGEYSLFEFATVTAEPDADFEFVGWFENGIKVSEDEVYSFKVTSDRTLTALFKEIVEEYFTITVQAGSANGTVTGGGVYAAGSTVTVTASPNSSYSFGGWYEGAILVSGERAYTFAVSSDRTLTASFTLAGSTGYSPGGQTSQTTTPPQEVTPIAPIDTPLAWLNPYIDVRESDWFYDAVSYVTQKNLMNGTSPDLFSPGMQTSRAMLVTVLHRLEGLPEVSGDMPFPDVAAGTWYYDAILWASQNEIVLGYDNGNFGPNDSITREQAVTILYRYAQAKGLDVSAAADLSGFADADSVSDYAVDAVKWAVAVGIIEGRTGNIIAPRDNSTRAELATILMRYIEDFIGEPEPAEPTEPE